MSARSCETVLKGTLIARFYYIYAIDYDRGGEWSGQAYMCTRDKEFTIKGTQDCLARGFDRTGFFEVDTGEQRAWTVQLTDTAEGPQQRPLTPGTPVLPTPGRQSPSQLPRGPAQMRRLRRTKIVATLGPASGNAEMIARLFEAGADVFRINMSHTPHDRMRELVAAIRQVEKDHNRPIGILVDLQGPKLRVGAFAGGSAMLDNGATFTFDADPKPGDATRVHLPHPEIFEGVKAGHTLLLDDGKIRLVATEASKQKIVVRVEVGGKLSDRKGVSLPDSIIPFSALTPEGPLRSRRRARRRHRLDRAVVRAAPRGHRRGQEDHARPRRRDGQDREAAGGAPDRRDHRPHRRASWWRAAISASRCRWKRCRASRSSSPAPRAAPASRWWWRRRCSKA